MQVPLLDLRAQYLTLRDELRAAVDRVFDTQRFVLGGEGRALEESIARYSGTSHGIGCASGSDALLLALMAVGVGPGDEVVTTPFSFFATAGAVARLGARPIFVDIDRRTFNIDVSRASHVVGPRTRAILPVHLYGQCAEMEALAATAARHGIPVIEDAAQAIGAEYRGRRAGSIGAVGCLSFYPTKNLGGAGDGGMLVTSDDALAARLRIMRVHGAEHRYNHSMVGINSRLDELQAAVLNVKLPYLESWSTARAENAARYGRLFEEAGLHEKITPPFTVPGCRHIYHQYVVRVAAGRDALRAHLAERGVGTDVYYPVPLHLQECFRYLGYSEGDFPEAEKAALETLALPIYPEITLDQQSYVVEAIREFFS